jgi:hypothetical protein
MCGFCPAIVSATKNPFLFRLMSKHGTTNYIADGIDTGHCSFEVIIYR